MANEFIKKLYKKFNGDEAAVKRFLEERSAAAAALPMGEVVERLALAALRPHSGELVGPCPVCGGRDRFAIHQTKAVFNCRICGGHGGVVQLVQHVMGCDYGAAVDWLLGDADLEISEAELQRRKEKRARDEARQRAASGRFRRQAISDARAIWQRSRDGNLGVVAAYLAARGISREMLPQIPRALHFIADHPYVKRIDREPVTMHRGPAMIAAIHGPGDDIVAVHQTWVDRSPPHGKARIVFDGEEQPAKLVRGSKKGGAIRLYTPRGADTLVMGEGIETTLSALVARPFANAAYWAGVDLGNMSGRMRKADRGARWSGIPDMADEEAFVPPAWVQRLVYIMDGDSDPAMTRAKLECGLRRAMALRPGLKGRIAKAGDGVDLNDVLTRSSPQNHEGAE